MTPEARRKIGHTLIVGSLIGLGVVCVYVIAMIVSLWLTAGSC